MTLTHQQRADLAGRYADALDVLLGEVTRDRAIAAATWDRETERDPGVIEHQLIVARNCAKASAGAAIKAVIERAQEQASHNLQVDR